MAHDAEIHADCTRDENDRRRLCLHLCPWRRKINIKIFMPIINQRCFT